jgi:molecular chaperone HscB
MDNYFELYNIPVTFLPDIKAVKGKFYELSRKYHPDRFANAEDTAKMEALRMAAINNDAYQTLGNRYETIAYILRLNGLLEDEEKYNLPPDFLMEMMELNEAISEYELEPDNEDMKTQAKNSLKTQLDYWDKEINPLIDKFEKGNHSKELLLNIKDYYFRKKYLLRIQQRIATFATR